MASLVIDLYPGEPRTHIWCDDCMTSGRFEVNLYTWGEHGPHLMTTYRRCLTCQPNEEQDG